MANNGHSWHRDFVELCVYMYWEHEGKEEISPLHQTQTNDTFSKIYRDLNLFGQYSRFIQKNRIEWVNHLQPSNVLSSISPSIEYECAVETMLIHRRRWWHINVWASTATSTNVTITNYQCNNYLIISIYLSAHFLLYIEKGNGRNKCTILSRSHN